MLHTVSMLDMLVQRWLIRVRRVWPLMPACFVSALVLRAKYTDLESVVLLLLLFFNHHSILGCFVILNFDLWTTRQVKPFLLSITGFTILHFLFPAWEICSFSLCINVGISFQCGCRGTGLSRCPVPHAHGTFKCLRYELILLGSCFLVFFKLLLHVLVYCVGVHLLQWTFMELRR